MKQIYDKLWQQSFPLLQNGQVEIDPLAFSASDTRRGVTLLFRPPSSLLASFDTFLQKARLIEPAQYYYPKSDIHLTVLSIISCYPGFDLQQIDLSEYRALIKKTVQQIPPFQITFKGITASPGSILIQGFEPSGALNQLRNILREQFKNSTLQHRIDHRYFIQTAHLTVLRFTQPIKPKSLTALLNEYRNVPFGTCEVNKLELVFNDWYQKEHLTKKIDTVIL